MSNPTRIGKNGLQEYAKTESVKELYIEKGGKIEASESEHIARIINGKEEASYRKVYNQLIKL